MYTDSEPPGNRPGPGSITLAALATGAIPGLLLNLLLLALPIYIALTHKARQAEGGFALLLAALCRSGQPSPATASR